MRGITLAALAAAATLTVTTAHAQLAGLIGRAAGLPRKGEAAGSYQSNNQVRVSATGGPYDDALLYRILVGKAAAMADAKGFSQIGVTKSKCTTVLTNGTPRSMSCYLMAVMLHSGEAAESRDDRQVQYYGVQEAQRGVIAPPVMPPR